MRLIDADELKRDLEISPFNDYDDYLRTERLIDDAPTIEERPKGKWIFRSGGYYKCNKCGEVERAEKNFCHNCGADNRGDV